MSWPQGEMEKKSHGSRPVAVSARPLSELGLSVRPYNALRRSGIKTIEELLALDEASILLVRNLGAKSLAEIREALLRGGPPEAAAGSTECTSDPVRRHLTEVGTSEREGAEQVAPEALQRRETAVAHEMPHSPCLWEEWSLPAWLEDDGTPMSELHLKGRAARLGLHAHLCTVAQLARLRLDELWAVKNVGPTTVHLVRTALEDYARFQAQRRPDQLRRPVTWPGKAKREQHASAISSFADVVTLWRANLSDREREIASHRLGLDGAQVETLDQLADRFHRTRERIRQLEHRAFSRLNNLPDGSLISPHRDALQRFLADKSGLASEEEVRRELGLYLNLGGFDPVHCCQIIAAASPELRWMPSLGVLAGSTTNQASILTVRRELRRLVPEGIDSLSLTHLLLACANSLSFQETCGLHTEPFLVACLRTDPEVTLADGIVAWPTRVPKAAQRIIDTLNGIGAPAQVWEIAARASEGSAPDDRVDERGVRAVLARYKNHFVRTGRGLYGLVQWVQDPSHNMELF